MNAVSTWTRTATLMRRAAALSDTMVYPRLWNALGSNVASRRLRRLLHHAWEYNTFYRALWQSHGIERRHLDDFMRFTDLPLVTKARLRETHYTDRISAGFDPSQGQLRQTSGSTGRPLVVFTPDSVWDRYLTLAHRVHSMHGVTPRDKLAYSAARPFDTGSHFGLFRHVWLDINAPIEAVAETIDREHPDALFVYPSVAEGLLESRGEAWCRSLGVKSVILNSDPSTPEQRRRLARSFGCLVGDEYSSEEVWLIAATCEAGEYHVFSDNVWLEILDDDDRPCLPGTPGRVVVTALHNVGMPFIRYEQGDIASLVPGRCACGRRTPLLGTIEGRVDDDLHLPSGRVVPAVNVRLVLKDISGVDAWQVRQGPHDEITLNVVPTRPTGATNAEEVLAVLRRELDPSVSTRVAVVSSLADAGRKAIVRE